MNGNVKAFFDDKHFGFIVGDDGQEYFVHQTAINDGATIKEGDAVTFDGEKGDKGLKAFNVSKADGDASGDAGDDSSDESSDDSGEDDQQEAA